MAVCHGILILALCMCFTAATATVNYADVRVRVVNAYAQHGHEMAEATSALQGLSKDTHMANGRNGERKHNTATVMGK